MSIGAIKDTIAKAPGALLAETNKLGNFVITKLPGSKAKADEFVKADLKKVNKNTAVGGAVLALAVGLAAGCIKTINSKVHDIKENN